MTGVANDDEGASVFVDRAGDVLAFAVTTGADGSLATVKKSATSAAQSATAETTRIVIARVEKPTEN